MSQLLSEVAATMRMHAVQKSIGFVFKSTAGKEDFFLGDPFRLRQILYNILGNAVKFTDQGEVTLEVRQETGGEKVQFLFVITDSGSGISPEDQRRIFHAFEQGSPGNTASLNGTGLGLSIAKELVENQHGEIRLD